MKRKKFKNIRGGEYFAAHIYFDNNIGWHRLVKTENGYTRPKDLGARRFVEASIMPHDEVYPIGETIQDYFNFIDGIEK